MTTPQPRSRSARIVSCVLALVLGVFALIGCTPGGDTTGLPPGTGPSAPQPLAGIPPAVFGRAGREVTVVATVAATTTRGCLQLTLPTTARTYRVVGPWATASPLRPGTRSLWWLTGHTLPRIEAADHAVDAPPTPGCDGAPAFYVDHAISLPTWLTDLFNALRALRTPLTPTPPHTALPVAASVPTTTTTPSSALIHRLGGHLQGELLRNPAFPATQRVHRVISPPGAPR